MAAEDSVVEAEGVEVAEVGSVKAALTSRVSARKCKYLWRACQKQARYLIWSITLVRSDKSRQIARVISPEYGSTMTKPPVSRLASVLSPTEILAHRRRHCKHSTIKCIRAIPSGLHPASSNPIWQSCHRNHKVEEAAGVAVEDLTGGEVAAVDVVVAALEGDVMEDSEGDVIEVVVMEVVVLEEIIVMVVGVMAKIKEAMVEEQADQAVGVMAVMVVVVVVMVMVVVMEEVMEEGKTVDHLMDKIATSRIKPFPLR